MQEEEDKILDLPEERKEQKSLIYLFWMSIPFFVYWFFAQLMHWPFSGQSLIIGAALLYLFILLRFLELFEKPLFQYFYFIGKSLLLAGTVLRLLDYYLSWYFFVFSAFSFGIGVLFTFFRGKGNDEEL